jgi:cellulose biosynthesis protein BcsQ
MIVGPPGPPISYPRDSAGRVREYPGTGIGLIIATIAGFKGGVGKSTTAVHLAAYLNAKAPTLLIDGDPNRSVTGWAKRGGLPFQVIDERQAARFARDYQHVVIDTQARPSREDLEVLAGGCDILVIPSTPDALALDVMERGVADARTNTDRERPLPPYRPA